MKPAGPIQVNGKTPLEKMTDLTRRIVAVRTTDLPARKKRRKKRPTDTS